MTVKSEMNDVYEIGVYVGKIEALNAVLDDLRYRLSTSRLLDADDRKFVEGQMADASIAILNIKAVRLNVIGDSLQ